MSRERRYTPTQGAKVETRADGTKQIVGYAAVFYRADAPGTQYELWPGNFERIAPGCFDRALREKDDCRALFNHNPDCVLGRASAGTLSLSVDAVGLRYEITPPDTQVGRDVLASIERGDISGSSFSFTIRSRTIRAEGDLTIRELNDVELYDVGPVTYPAYAASTTGTRAEGDIEEAKADIETFKASRACEAIATRKRLLEIRERETA